MLATYGSDVFSAERRVLRRLRLQGVAPDLLVKLGTAIHELYCAGISPTDVETVRGLSELLVFLRQKQYHWPCFAVRVQV